MENIGNMQNMHFCQSCAMPLSDETKAVNPDGSKNEDYCSYCYADGKFSWDCSMDQMIDFCAQHMAEANPGMTEDAAKAQMKGFFPQLKRWKA